MKKDKTKKEKRSTSIPENGRPSKKPGVFKTLARSVREYKVYAILNPLMMIMEVACEMSLTYRIQYLINAISDGDMPALWLNAGLLLLFACLALLFGFLGGRIAAIAATGFARNVRQDLFDRIQDFSFANIDRFSSSSLVTRMTTDIGYVQMAFQMLIRITFRVPLMMIFAIAMAFSINHALSWIFVIILPILAFVLGLVAFFSYRIFSKVFHKYDKLNESVQENIRGIRVVKDYVREDYEIEKFAKASDTLKKEFTKAERIAALVNPTMNVCMFTASIAVSVLGSLVIINSRAGEVPAIIGGYDLGDRKSVV